MVDVIPMSFLKADWSCEGMVTLNRPSMLDRKTNISD